MTRTTLAIGHVLITLSACGLTLPDPCADTSPLQVDPEVAAKCEQQDETGGDEADGQGLTCEVVDQSENYSGAEFCYVGTYDIYGFTGSYKFKAKSECATLSAEFPCNRKWQSFDPLNADQGGGGGGGNGQGLPPDGDAAGTTCVLCAPDHFGSPAQPKPASETNTGWRLCMPDPQVWPDPMWAPGEWKPAVVDDMPAGTSHWIDDLTCQEYTDPGIVCGGGGFVALDPPANNDQMIFYSTFTCRCENDEDCQTGAVCEAGWVADPWPHATLCTWDDGTANGAAPDGPEVYGLDQWSDGITVVRSTVTITGSMLLALVPGVFNDDQRFAESGTLTHCGPDALCSFLGLAVGDTVLAEQLHLDDLMNGLPTSIPVQRADGSIRWLTVSVDFDGTL